MGRLASIPLALRDLPRAWRFRRCWRAMAAGEKKWRAGELSEFLTPALDEKRLARLASDLASPGALRGLLDRCPPRALAFVALLASRSAGRERSLLSFLAPPFSESSASRERGEALFFSALSLSSRPLIDALAQALSPHGGFSEGFGKEREWGLLRQLIRADELRFADLFSRAFARGPFFALTLDADPAQEQDWVRLLGAWRAEPPAPQDEPVEVWREKLLGRMLARFCALASVPAGAVLRSSALALLLEHAPGEGRDALMAAAIEHSPELVAPLFASFEKDGALNRLRAPARTPTPLMLAAGYGGPEALALLLPGSDLRARDVEGRTALAHACSGDLVEADAEACALALIEAMHAEKEALLIPDDDDWSPIEHASFAGLPRVVEALIDAGVPAGHQAPDFAPIFSIAADPGASDALVERVARATDFAAMRGMHSAYADRCRAETPFTRLGRSGLPVETARKRLSILLAHGADPRIFDGAGRTPLAASAHDALGVYADEDCGPLMAFAQALDPAQLDAQGLCALESFVVFCALSSLSGKSKGAAPWQGARPGIALRARRVACALRDALLRHGREDLVEKSFAAAARAGEAILCDELAEHAPADWRRSLPRKARKTLLAMAASREVFPRWAALEEARALRGELGLPESRSAAQSRHGVAASPSSLPAQDDALADRAAAFAPAAEEKKPRRL
jgi:hypothetical protein